MIYKLTRADGVVEYRQDSSTVLPEGAVELTQEQMDAELKAQAVQFP